MLTSVIFSDPEFTALEIRGSKLSWAVDTALGVSHTRGVHWRFFGQALNIRSVHTGGRFPRTDCTSFMNFQCKCSQSYIQDFYQSSLKDFSQNFISNLSWDYPHSCFRNFPEFSHAILLESCPLKFKICLKFVSQSSLVL